MRRAYRIVPPTFRNLNCCLVGEHHRQVERQEKDQYEAERSRDDGAQQGDKPDGKFTALNFDHNQNRQARIMRVSGQW